MKASELIKALQEILMHDGDFEVRVDPGPGLDGRDDTVFDIEYIDATVKYIWIGVKPINIKD